MDVRIACQILLLTAIISFSMNTSSSAQSQKYEDAYQKSYSYQKGAPSPGESNQADEGGYQAPPPTGAMQGPFRELGISGGEIELPAIKLRLPRLRLPALSTFLTAPQMHTEGGIAPMVQQVQNQIGVPTSSNQLGPGESNQEKTRYQTPYQKSKYGAHTQDSREGQNSPEIARMRIEMDEFENRLDGRIALLASSIEKLVEVKEREIKQQRPRGLSQTLEPLPIVKEVEQSAVQQSSYTTTRQLTPTRSAHIELYRVLSTTSAPTQSGMLNRPQRLPPLPVQPAPTLSYR